MPSGRRASTPAVRIECPRSVVSRIRASRPLPHTAMAAPPNVRRGSSTSITTPRTRPPPRPALPPRLSPAFSTALPSFAAYRRCPCASTNGRAARGTSPLREHDRAACAPRERRVQLTAGRHADRAARDRGTRTAPPAGPSGPPGRRSPRPARPGVSRRPGRPRRRSALSRRRGRAISFTLAVPSTGPRHRSSSRRGSEISSTCHSVSTQTAMSTASEPWRMYQKS